MMRMNTEIWFKITQFVKTKMVSLLESQMEKVVTEKDI